jgi:hypothetical protein
MREETDLAILGPFFGSQSGNLTIYVAHFPIGTGTFQAIDRFQARFSGSYKTFFQTHPLNLMIKLSDQDASSASGPCQITFNDKVDTSATYKTSRGKITFSTSLAQSPIDVYRSQGGTQIDGLDGHDAWIG